MILSPFHIEYFTLPDRDIVQEQLLLVEYLPISSGEENRYLIGFNGEFDKMESPHFGTDQFYRNCCERITGASHAVDYMCSPLIDLSGIV